MRALKGKGQKALALAALFFSATFLQAFDAHAQSPDETEIRVIRNKFFEKSMRLELSAGLGVIMNQSFLYTYLGGLNLGFHLTEQFALLGEAHFGQTFRKDDCEVLGTNFSIDPLVQEVQSYFGGAVDYTPIYGKFQLASGRVVYFDWFLEAGMGMAGIQWGGLGCAAGGTGSEGGAETVSAYAIAANGSMGQRIFVNTRMSVNWRVRFMRAERVLPSAKGEGAEKTGIADGENFVMLNLGVSYFL